MPFRSPSRPGCPILGGPRCKYVAKADVTTKYVRIDNTAFEILRNSTERGIILGHEISKPHTTVTQKLEALREYMCVPLPKKHLSSVMDIQSADPIFTAIENLNFFRDTYKSDVAVQLNGLLMCGDRVLALYHKMLCKYESENKSENEECQLLCVFPDNHGARLIT